MLRGSCHLGRGVEATTRKEPSKGHHVMLSCGLSCGLRTGVTASGITPLSSAHGRPFRANPDVTSPMQQPFSPGRSVVASAVSGRMDMQHSPLPVAERVMWLSSQAAEAVWVARRLQPKFADQRAPTNGQLLFGLFSVACQQPNSVTNNQSSSSSRIVEYGLTAETLSARWKGGQVSNRADTSSTAVSTEAAAASGGAAVSALLDCLDQELPRLGISKADLLHSLSTIHEGVAPLSGAYPTYGPEDDEAAGSGAGARQGLKGAYIVLKDALWLSASLGYAKAEPDVVLALLLTLPPTLNPLLIALLATCREEDKKMVPGVLQKVLSACRVASSRFRTACEVPRVHALQPCADPSVVIGQIMGSSPPSTAGRALEILAARLPPYASPSLTFGELLKLLGTLVTAGVVPSPALGDLVRERLDALRRTRIPRPGEAEAALVLTALLGIRLPPSGLLRGLVSPLDNDAAPDLSARQDQAAFLQAYAWHVGGRPDVSGCGITSLTGRAAWTRSALLSTSSQMVAEAAHQLASVTSSSGNSSSGRSSGEEDGASSADDYPDVVQRDALEYLWAPQRMRSNAAARARTGSGFTAGPGYGSGYQPLSALHQEPAGRLPRLVFLTGPEMGESPEPGSAVPLQQQYLHPSAYEMAGCLRAVTMLSWPRISPETARTLSMTMDAALQKRMAWYVRHDDEVIPAAILVPDMGIEASNLVEAACLLSSVISSSDKASETCNLNLLQTAAELLSAADCSASAICLGIGGGNEGAERVSGALEAAHSLALCQVAARLTSILARTHGTARDKPQATGTPETPLYKAMRVACTVQGALPLVTIPGFFTSLGRAVLAEGVHASSLRADQFCTSAFRHLSAYLPDQNVFTASRTPLSTYASTHLLSDASALSELEAQLAEVRDVLQGMCLFANRVCEKEASEQRASQQGYDRRATQALQSTILPVAAVVRQAMWGAACACLKVVSSDSGNSSNSRESTSSANNIVSSSFTAGSGAASRLSPSRSRSPTPGGPLLTPLQALAMLETLKSVLDLVCTLPPSLLVSLPHDWAKDIRGAADALSARCRTRLGPDEHSRALVCIMGVHTRLNTVQEAAAAAKAAAQAVRVGSAKGRASSRATSHADDASSVKTGCGSSSGDSTVSTATSKPSVALAHPAKEAVNMAAAAAAGATGTAASAAAASSITSSTSEATSSASPTAEPVPVPAPPAADAAAAATAATAQSSTGGGSPAPEPTQNVDAMAGQSRPDEQKQEAGADNDDGESLDQQRWGGSLFGALPPPVIKSSISDEEEGDLAWDDAWASDYEVYGSDDVDRELDDDELRFFNEGAEVVEGDSKTRGEQMKEGEGTAHLDDKDWFEEMWDGVAELFGFESSDTEQYPAVLHSGDRQQASSTGPAGATDSSSTTSFLRGRTGASRERLSRTSAPPQEPEGSSSSTTGIGADAAEPTSTSAVSSGTGVSTPVPPAGDGKGVLSLSEVAQMLQTSADELAQSSSDTFQAILTSAVQAAAGAEGLPNDKVPSMLSDAASTPAVNSSSPAPASPAPAPASAAATGPSAELIAMVSELKGLVQGMAQSQSQLLQQQAALEAQLREAVQANALAPAPPAAAAAAAASGGGSASEAAVVQEKGVTGTDTSTGAEHVPASDGMGSSVLVSGTQQLKPVSDSISNSKGSADSAVDPEVAAMTGRAEVPSGKDTASLLDVLTLLRGKLGDQPAEDEIEEVILTFVDPDTESAEEHPLSLRVWSLLEVVERHLRLQQQALLKEQKERWLHGYQEQGGQDAKASCNALVGKAPLDKEELMECGLRLVMDITNAEGDYCPALKPMEVVSLLWSAAVLGLSVGPQGLVALGGLVEGAVQQGTLGRGELALLVWGMDRLQTENARAQVLALASALLSEEQEQGMGSFGGTDDATQQLERFRDVALALWAVAALGAQAPKEWLSEGSGLVSGGFNALDKASHAAEEALVWDACEIKREDVDVTYDTPLLLAYRTLLALQKQNTRME